MDGLELLAEIRTRRPDTPTLMITAYGENDLVVGALRGGACDFIQKPVDRDYLIAALQRAMETREASRRVRDGSLRWSATSANWRPSSTSVRANGGRRTRCARAR